MPLQQGAAPAAAGVQLVLSDKGRAEVEGKLGSAVDKVEGTIISQNSDSYTIAVSQVYLLRGGSSKWNGEQVTVAKDGVTGYQLHRYNQTRTVVLAVARTTAAVVFLASIKLIGGGSDQSGSIGCPTCQTH